LKQAAICPHCLNSGDAALRSDPASIAVDAIAKAFIGGETSIKCPNSNVEVAIQEIGPDICFTHQNMPLLQNVQDLKQIAKGGFGLIYQGTWNGKVVAVKELLVDPHVESTEKVRNQSPRPKSLFHFFGGLSTSPLEL